MKHGYVLLEVLIAVAISVTALASIFSSFYSVNKNFVRAKQIADVDTSIALLQHQLERDVAGIFIPMVAKQKRDGEKAIKKPDEKVANGKKGQEQTKQQAQGQQELIPLDKAFYVEMKEGQVQLITFVTSSTLPSYNMLKSRIARVVYTLELDKEAEKFWGKRSYKLFRQEAPVLDFTQFKQLKQKSAAKYELVDNIKSFTLEYVVEIVKKSEEKSKENMAGKATEGGGKIEYKTYKVWSKKQVEETKKLRPDFLNLTVSFWDNARKNFNDFECKMLIMGMQTTEGQKNDSMQKQQDGGEKKDAKK